MWFGWYISSSLLVGNTKLGLALKKLNNQVSLVFDMAQNERELEIIKRGKRWLSIKYFKMWHRKKDERESRRKELCPVLKMGEDLRVEFKKLCDSELEQILTLCQNTVTGIQKRPASKMS